MRIFFTNEGGGRGYGLLLCSADQILRSLSEVSSTAPFEKAESAEGKEDSENDEAGFGHDSLETRDASPFESDPDHSGGNESGGEDHHEIPDQAAFAGRELLA